MTRFFQPLIAILLVAAAGPSAPLSAGKWQTRIEVIDVVMPSAPPGMAAMFKGKPTVVSSCLTPQQAAQGPRAAMEMENKHCQVVKYDMAGGRFASKVVCKRSDGIQTTTSMGTYTATSYNAVGTSVATGKMPMTMKTRVTGKRVGGC